MWLKVEGGAVINSNAIAFIEERTVNTAEVTLVTGRKFTLVYDRPLDPGERVDWDIYMTECEYAYVYEALLNLICDAICSEVNIPEGLKHAGLSEESITDIVARITGRLDSIDDSIVKGFKYIKNELG